MQSRFSPGRRRLATPAVCLTLLSAGCGRPGCQADTPPLSLVAMSKSAAGADAGTRNLVTIVHDREVSVSVGVGGIIVRSPLRIGDDVSPGRKIAHLDAIPCRAVRVRAEEDVAKLARALARSRQFTAAGAVAPAVDQDSSHPARTMRHQSWRRRPTIATRILQFFPEKVYIARPSSSHSIRDDRG